MANVFSMVAEQTRFNNVNVTDIPLLNISGTISGPLNANPVLQTPFSPPDIHARGAGGGPVFVAKNCDLSQIDGREGVH